MASYAALSPFAIHPGRQVVAERPRTQLSQKATSPWPRTASYHLNPVLQEILIQDLANRQESTHSGPTVTAYINSYITTKTTLLLMFSLASTFM